MAKLVLREDFIKLGQALKAAKLVGSGVEAKIVILDGKVKVNGQVELQRGKKLYDKRDADAQRSAKREIDRTIKEKNY